MVICMKECGRCRETKPLEDFYWQKPQPARGRSGRYSTDCKECVREHRRRWGRENSEHLAAWRRNHRIQRLYGLTSQEYDDLFKSQDGRCAICKTDTPNGSGRVFHVDHDHETGKPRGLLCWTCNSRLGVLEDQLWREAAEAYLASPPLLVFKRGW